MFDIHKVKPIHGWREFIGEVGIIVLGVAIALMAEQIVEAVHWRGETAKARAELGTNLTETLALVRERELYSRCIARRVRDVAEILAEAGRTGRLPPVAPIGQPSIRNYTLPTWSALTSSGLVSHFHHDDVIAYGQLASAAEEMTALNRAELADWASLHAIVGPGRPIGAEELGQHYRELSQIGYRAKLVRMWGAAILDDVRQGHMPLNRDEVGWFSSNWPKMRARVRQRQICQPLGEAPAQYGAAPPDNYALDGPVEQD